jgi:maltose alpha-D-glucosyltransferase/alpha-amylase
MARSFALEDEPLWYKDAVVYEVHVRAFHDGNGDGIGDFPGLTEKLDYIRDLGVTALWLLPFYPSPLRDDGYDIADYDGVHPDYGTLRDFRTFLNEAHRRGLRVITELVINHTSDRHPWFQRARRAPPDSRYRNFYVWSDSPDRYKEARIIFKDFEPSNWTWDPEAKAYYWHRFYSHQPDLNFESADVRRAVEEVVDFWLGMGVDGLRLDAVPYLYEREGTSCENLPETHSYLKELRRHIDSRFPNRMLLAEANQWPEEAALYFGEGDECNMAFHFPVMPRLFMAVHMEDRFPIVDILRNTPAIPENAQWAIFLRNHDELTLEMVTDEDRDYMYRVYAQDLQARINLGIRRRLAPLLGNHRRKIELMIGLLFSLPGTPVLYYGDEIGMGDNIYLGDRNGVRTPMQWSSDRNAGFSKANPQRLYLPVIIDPEYHYETVNVSAQQNNLHSLLWWTKRMIALRKRYRAFSRGQIDFVQSDNPRVLSFVRKFQDETVLVVANLSRFVQGVSLELEEFAGNVPIEIFGRTHFPGVTTEPYFLSLGPHTFYWFSLERQVGEARAGAAPAEGLPTLVTAGAWEELLENQGARLAGILPDFLRQRRWFGAKARTINRTRVLDALPLPLSNGTAAIALVGVEYLSGEPETYVLPLMVSQGEAEERLMAEAPEAALARLRRPAGDPAGVLHDALYSEPFCIALLEVVGRRRRLEGRMGAAQGLPTRVFRRTIGEGGAALRPSVFQGEQSNTSVIYGQKLILKLLRRADPGLNPDVEIGRLLTEASFAGVPALAGYLEYTSGQEAPRTLAILHAYVPNEGDAWRYTLAQLGRYYEDVLALRESVQEVPLSDASLEELARTEPPALAVDAIGGFLESARLLGRRTAELHLALAAERQDAGFAPEPFTPFYQRSLFESMRGLATNALQLLRGRLASLPAEERSRAEALLAREAELSERFRSALERPVSALRTRVHGDYHLGQVLFTGSDFVIIDFEGEPARPLSERRIKRSPLRDVAGMLRSFHYAASATLADQLGGSVRPEDRPVLEPWSRFWLQWVGACFLQGYLSVAEGAGFLPADRRSLAEMIEVYILEKAVYELAYELNNRPGWVRIPLDGILGLLDRGRHG